MLLQLLQLLLLLLLLLQFLHPEDIIVFEVTGAAAIQVHIFRCAAQQVFGP
jgi:hypothetical protein